MKKTAALIVLLCLASPLHASTIGNVETVGKGKISLATGGDFLFDRRLEADIWEIHETFDVAGSLQYFDLGLNVTKPRIERQYRTTGQIVYGLLENLDIHLALGTGQQEIKGSFKGNGFLNITDAPLITSINVYDGTYQLKTDNSFFYGGGLKLMRAMGDGWSIGCNAQYSREEYHYKGLRRFTVDVPSEGVFGVRFNEGWHGKLTAQEWTAAPYLAKKMGNFTPYAGFVYTYFSLKDRARLPTSIANTTDPAVVDLSTNSYNLKYRNRFSMGGLIGLQYRWNESWKFNFEYRFCDETAISLEGSYIF